MGSSGTGPALAGGWCSFLMPVIRETAAHSCMLINALPINYKAFIEWAPLKNDPAI